ncbi:GGDEF domain-containing response regulator [bacterium]|nr:MAG: GGDEF domain-containing response regulator [bacterium]MCL4231707.1 diguanylate cyclase [Dehalococcoidia bacterium]
MPPRTLSPAGARAERHALVRVLVVDLEIDDVKRLRATFEGDGGFRIHTARTLEEAEERLASGAFDVTLIESSLWSPEGADLVRFVRDRRLDIAVVLLTSGSQRDALPALKLGAHDFISKQFLDDAEHVTARVLAAVAESRTLRRRETMVRWLEREARTDHMTGLANRRAFDEHLQKTSDEARRAGEPLALILVDVTGTRQVNEAYGHPSGDAMIRRAARAVASSIRGCDFAGRIGGDDFGVLIRGGDMELARRIARRIAHEIERLNNEGLDGEIPVSVSFGVASGPASNAADLFAAADQQLSAHKGLRPAITPFFLAGEDDGPSVA